MAKQTKEEIDQEKKEVADFFKHAFCVDGEAKFVESRAFSIIGVVELNDSERGKFYVARVRPWDWHFKNKKMTATPISDLGGIEHQDFKAE